MKTHLIACIDKLEYHSSQYSKLTVDALEQQFVLWMGMKLSKSTYGFSSQPFLFTIETKTKPDGQKLHMVENIQPWKAQNAEKADSSPKSPAKTSNIAQADNGQVEHERLPRRIRLMGSARRAH